MYEGIAALKMARYRPSAYRLDGAGENASEEALAGLIQSQLLKRFESSWYAALQTITRMRDAYQVLLRVIEVSGMVPPPEAIRDLVGAARDDDTFLDSDLIDEALADSEGSARAEEFNDELLPDLRNDRDRLADMAARLERLPRPPGTRSCGCSSESWPRLPQGR